MANIPVEKRSGTPWWLWLLGLVLIAGLVWLALELFDEEPDADEIAGTEDNVGLVDDVEVDIDEEGLSIVTTEDQLFTTDAAGAEEPVAGGTLDGVTVTRLEPGTPVEIENTRVLSVIGDSAFWIGQDDARRYLVVLAGLGESELGAGGTDGVFNVDEGETVSIDGAIARYREGDPGLSELTDEDSVALRERNAYIRVNSREDITVSGS